MIARLARHFPLALLISASLTLVGCGYNDFQRLDEQTKSAWAEVLNQYQRRADLIPNLVETVKGEANFEQETLSRVIEARSRATAIQVTPEMLNDPQAMERFQQAQGQLGSALASARGLGELSQPQGQPGLPGSPDSARRHREPRHRGAQQVHRGRAAVQRPGAQFPHQSDRHDLQLFAQGRLHGDERSRNLVTAEGRFRRSGHTLTASADDAHGAALPVFGLQGSAGGQRVARPPGARARRGLAQRALLVDRPGAGGATGAGVDGTGDRQQRHPERSTDRRTRQSPRCIRAGARQPDRGLAGPDHSAGGHRCLRLPRG